MAVSRILEFTIGWMTLLALAPAPVEAATTVVLKATVRDCNAVRCRPPEIRYGSGVVVARKIGESPIVLTAGHVVRNCDSVEIGWESGRWLAGRVLAVEVSSNVDLAAVAVEFPDAVELGWLARTAADGPAVLTGYTLYRGWRNHRGELDYERSCLVGVRAEPGESGGPIVSPATGEILGIVWGTDGRDSYLTDASRIQEWLRVRLGWEDIAAARPPPVALPPKALDAESGDVARRMQNLEQEVARLRDAAVRVQIRHNGQLIDEGEYRILRDQPIVLDFRKK